MNRGAWTNLPWERLHPLLPPQKPTTGRPAHDPRPIIHGRVWRRRTGAPWRDLPEREGPWRTVARRGSRWQRAGIWSQLVAAVQAHAAAAGPRHGDLQDRAGPMLRAHPHAAGAPTGAQRAKPGAGAGAGAVPQSTGGPKEAASGGPACAPLDSGTRRASARRSWSPVPSSGGDQAVPRAAPSGLSAITATAAGRCRRRRASLGFGSPCRASATHATQAPASERLTVSATGPSGSSSGVSRAGAWRRATRSAPSPLQAMGLLAAPS